MATKLGIICKEVPLKKKNSGNFSNYYPSSEKLRSSRRAFFIRASASSQEPPLDDNNNKFYKELGMFSLRKRIEESVLRAETLGPTALQLEEAKHFNQEEVVRDYDLWDDLSKSNEILTKLSDSAKVVDTLRDLKYQAEEAKLITELAENDAINYALFKQAYSSSLDLNKFLDRYEMSKFLKEPYDVEGACIILESKSDDIYSEIWAGQLADMYMKWAERQGHAGRMIDKFPSNNGGIKYATIELEFQFAYGYLSGEKGVHSMIRSFANQAEACVASVDVIPLFIESSPDLLINDEDILSSNISHCTDNLSRTSAGVQIQHMPTGLQVQSTGERSRFANKIKALNRLKAKLLTIMKDQGISSIQSIKKDANLWNQETRKYVFRPSKMVQDLKTGIQIPDVDAVLNGNLDPLIAAHLNSRQTSSTVI